MSNLRARQHSGVVHGMLAIVTRRSLSRNVWPRETRAHCSFLAKLRGGFAPLEIETGRYVSTPAEYRTCKLCDTGVEDETHFVLHCPALSSERHLLVIHMRASIPTYESLNSLDQLCCIISGANKNRKNIKIFILNVHKETVSINCIDILLYFT